MRKTLCILLAIVLVPSCSACRSQEDNIYDELTQKSSTVSSEGLQPEGSAATQGGGEKHLSGDSADIVGVELLDFYKYATSNLFMDYYELMDNDPDFRQEDYYCQTLNTCMSVSSELMSKSNGGTGKLL